jgi:hypothetical protein
VTHIVVARTEPCLTTLKKHFARTETHIDVTQRPRYEETHQSLSLAWLHCGYTNGIPIPPILAAAYYCPSCLIDPEKLHNTSAVAHNLLQHFHTEVHAYFKVLFPGKWTGREGPIP